jgi:predicted nucleotidyltransferase
MNLTNDELATVEALIASGEKYFGPATMSVTDQMMDAMMNQANMVQAVHEAADRQNMINNAMDHAMHEIAQAEHAHAEHAQAEHAQAEHADHAHDLAEADHNAVVAYRHNADGITANKPMIVAELNRREISFNEILAALSER